VSGFSGSSNNDAIHFTRTSAFSRHHPPEFCKFIGPQKKKGAGKTGCALHPRSHVQRHTKNAHEHRGSAEAVRPSLRNGFTAYFVLSPVRPGLFVTVAPKMRELLANLTPATGASGPHDFAVRITRRSSKAHPRPPLPAPNVRDDRETSLSWGTGWRGISS
jgi:hypothetical protein